MAAEGFKMVCVDADQAGGHLTLDKEYLCVGFRFVGRKDAWPIFRDDAGNLAGRWM